MRAVWKGALAFGMVSIPVWLYLATEDRTVSFHLVHERDGGRIRQPRVCTVCGEEIAYADLVKGFELPSGETVLLREEDLANLPLPTTKIVQLVAFVPADQIDPLALSRGYYLEPEPAGHKPYELLRAALERTQRVGLAKIAVRSKESLAALRPRGNTLVLQTMLWPDEIRKAEFDVLGREVGISAAEVRMAEGLIEAMATDFVPEAYHDGYREALLSVIEAKTAGPDDTARPEPAPTGEPTPAGDLLSALAASVASVEAAKAARSKLVSVPAQRARPESAGHRPQRHR